jgi:outer membrane protein assembly factor BamB
VGAGTALVVGDVPRLTCPGEPDIAIYRAPVEVTIQPSRATARIGGGSVSSCGAHPPVSGGVSAGRVTLLRRGKRPSCSPAPSEEPAKLGGDGAGATTDITEGWLVVASRLFVPCLPIRRRGRLDLPTRENREGKMRRPGNVRKPLVGLMVLPMLAALLLGGCQWPQYRFGPARTGYNPAGSPVSVANVATLAETWRGPTGDRVFSSPAVVNGVVYIGSEDGKLYAFDANGFINCSGVPNVCNPLWTATTAGPILSSPAVVSGVVYVASYDKYLYAFDAAGNANCSGSPKMCDPLWSAATPTGSTESSPAVDNGIVYLTSPGSPQALLYAFDAAGNINCFGSPKTCQPLWTASIGVDVRSSPAVANGVVYVGSDDHNLYAFDAAGTINCSGNIKTCAPLWTANVGDRIWSSPAVDHGTVYIGSNNGNLYAFDASGVTGCAGMPKVCNPLWAGATGGLAGSESSPAVANGIAYIGSTDGSLYAFDAAGTPCSGNPKICTPLWRAPTTGPILHSSPAVANGVVYIGSQDHSVYAFDAAGLANCSGNPKVCTPLWAAPTLGGISASPAAGGPQGGIYVGSLDGNVYAFLLPSS